eukprot:UN07875
MAQQILHRNILEHFLLRFEIILILKEGIVSLLSSSLGYQTVQSVVVKNNTYVLPVILLSIVGICGICVS